MPEPDLTKIPDIKNMISWYKTIEDWMKAAVKKINEQEEEIESLTSTLEDLEYEREPFMIIIEYADDVARGIRSYDELMEKVNDARPETASISST